MARPGAAGLPDALADAGGGRTRARGELLSFLLFDDLYFDLLIEAGKRDAQSWLDRHPDFWCSEAGHDFDFDTGRMAAAVEPVAAEPARAAS